MTKPLQLETSAEPAYPAGDSGVAGFGPEYDRSEDLHRKASFWRDGAASCVEHRVRVSFLRGPMAPSGRTGRALFLRDDAIRRVIV